MAVPRHFYGWPGHRHHKYSLFIPGICVWPWEGFSWSRLVWGRAGGLTREGSQRVDALATRLDGRPENVVVWVSSDGFRGGGFGLKLSAARLVAACSTSLDWWFICVSCRVRGCACWTCRQNCNMAPVVLVSQSLPSLKKKDKQQHVTTPAGSIMFVIAGSNSQHWTSEPRVTTSLTSTQAFCFRYTTYFRSLPAIARVYYILVALSFRKIPPCFSDKCPVFEHLFVYYLHIVWNIFC